MSRDESRDFAQEIFQNGCSLLPCGGGVTFEPLRAISSLKNKYGTARLKQLCMKLLVSDSHDTNHPEGVIEVAQGILYHLADEEVLRELIKIYKRPMIYPHSQRDLGKLIGGICNNLNLPTPPGITSLDIQEEHFLFRQERP